MFVTYLRLKKKDLKRYRLSAEDAHEIEAFDGDVVAMEDNIEGYPLHRYEEDEDGNYSPTHSAGDDTWELQEIVLKYQTQYRLGEKRETKKFFIHIKSIVTIRKSVYI